MAKGEYARHQLVLRLPKDLKSRLARAKRKGKVSYNDITIAALEAWLKKEGR